MTPEPLPPNTASGETSKPDKAQKLKRRSRKRVQERGVHLIYKIEGKPNEVDVFRLGLLLESVGSMLADSSRTVFPSDSPELSIRVAPFKKGSFILDFVLEVKQQIGLLFLLSQTDEVKQLKTILEDLGLVQKAIEKGASLLQLIKNLGGSEPAKVVESEGPDTFDYHSADGTVTPVSMQVHKLYNHGTINNYIMPALGAPLSGDGVSGIKTFLKGAEDLTSVELTKEDLSWIEKFADPIQAAPLPERIENTTVQLLHPKSGNYGETSGTWTFTVAGSKRTIKASIVHQDFLSKYASGVVRFYSGDTLKAKVHETQTIDNSGEHVFNEIIEVIEYRKARSK